MSKSLGNLYTLDGPARPRRSIRARSATLLLSVHYRQKLNFTFDSVEQATAALRRVDDLRFRLGHAQRRRRRERRRRPPPRRGWRRDFAAALADDLNVSAALAARVRLRARGQRGGRGGPPRRRRPRASSARALREVDAVLGVLTRKSGHDGDAAPAAGLAEAEIESLVAEREAARRAATSAASDAHPRPARATAESCSRTPPPGPRWKPRVSETTVTDEVLPQTSTLSPTPAPAAAPGRTPPASSWPPPGYRILERNVSTTSGRDRRRRRATATRSASSRSRRAPTTSTARPSPSSARASSAGWPAASRSISPAARSGIARCASTCSASSVRRRLAMRAGPRRVRSDGVVLGLTRPQRDGRIRRRWKAGIAQG